MDFLRIGDSKIKIVITADELKEYGIFPREDGSAAASRRTVWQILDRAKSECGFDAHGDKVLVQFYPMRDGCEMFVTKLGILEANSARAVARSERVTLLSRREKFYFFTSYSDLRRAVREISRRFPELPKSSLFSSGENYVLSIEELSGRDDVAELAFIREFASALPRELAAYISEHYDTVYTDNAVKSVAESGTL